MQLPLNWYHTRCIYNRFGFHQHLCLLQINKSTLQKILLPSFRYQIKETTWIASSCDCATCHTVGDKRFYVFIFIISYRNVFPTWNKFNLDWFTNSWRVTENSPIRRIRQYYYSSPIASFRSTGSIVKSFIPGFIPNKVCQRLKCISNKCLS